MATGGESRLAGRADAGRADGVPVALVLMALVAVGLLVAHCHQPPPVVPADAPAHVFSAERASERLARLLGDERPHPMASPANEAVRERLLGELEPLGLASETNDHWLPAPGTWSTGLVRVRNVLAELPSSHPERPAILLACHYDSVPAGPGASDDGAAMAVVLEVARILKAEAPLERPVILLFTDGEEIGLFGARAFARTNPLAKRTGIVLNFEARGTSGGSLMFETSRHNRWMIEQARKGLRRPMSSSAYVTVYRMMPNSSDLTVFLESGMAGMNFAYIGTPKQYHTPLDNLAHLDRRSVQHHGENALAMVRQLLADDWAGADAATGDAVYTDLFARAIIAWPAAWGPWIAALILVVLVVAVRARRPRLSVPPRELSRAVSCWLLALVAGGGFAWLSGSLLQRAGAGRSWWPADMHFGVAVHCLSATVGVLTALLLFRPGPVALLLAHRGLLALGALILSLAAPGFSYLFLIPAAVAVLAAVVLAPSAAGRGGLVCVCLAPAIATVVLTVPFLLRLPEALGLWLSAPVVGAVTALTMQPVLPLLASLRLATVMRGALVLLAATGVMFYLAVRNPVFTSESPQHLNLTFLEQEGLPIAQLFCSSREGDIPPALLKGLTRLELTKPVYTVPGTAVEAAPAGLRAPHAEVVESSSTGDEHRARLRLIPSAPGQEVLAGIPVSHELGRVVARGESLALPPGEKDGRKWLRFLGAPEDGIEIDLTWRGPPDLPLALAGVTTGLPAHLADFAARRVALPATPAHMGDRTIVVKEVLFPSEPR